MNALSPSLSQTLARLSRPVSDVGAGERRPDYIAAIEAAMNRPVGLPQDGPAKPVEAGYSGNATSLVNRLQGRRPPTAAPVVAKPLAPPLPTLVLTQTQVPPPPAFSGLALGPITVTLPPQRLGYRLPTRAQPPAVPQPPPALSAADRLLLLLSDDDSFNFKASV
jgi:hypothetical protein